MSLVAQVESIADSLPPAVHAVLKAIASEVEAHKALLSEVGALGGPAGETVATEVEAASAAIESASPATTVPTVISTGGEVGNPEQSTPYEAQQWPGA